MVLCVGASSAWAAPVKFNRDVRAILSKNCFACHGQDAKKRKGKLRLGHCERRGRRVCTQKMGSGDFAWEFFGE